MRFHRFGQKMEVFCLWEMSNQWKVGIRDKVELYGQGCIISCAKLNFPRGSRPWQVFICICGCLINCQFIWEYAPLNHRIDSKDKAKSKCFIFLNKFLLHQSTTYMGSLRAHRTCLPWGCYCCEIRPRKMSQVCDQEMFCGGKVPVWQNEMLILAKYVSDPHDAVSMVVCHIYFLCQDQWSVRT